MTVLVTGTAGFIGFHVARRLLAEGYDVVGFDSVTDYYDTSLKRSRLEILAESSDFRFIRADLADAAAVKSAFECRPEIVINLAAQAGVRYSLDNPQAYVDANVTGFLNILENCPATQPKHLIYASSSSVYGGNKKQPYSPRDGVDHPVSLYAATKKANELMAHTYSHLFGVPATGLRFFTVYGPWGRPDMAYYKFTRAIFAGETIDIYNNGDMYRDFTYVDDIVEGILRLIDLPPKADADYDIAAGGASGSWAPHRVMNIGNRRKEHLMEMIRILERATGREAVKNFMPLQPGDVLSTWADVSDLEALIGELPHTPIEEGLLRFVDWYGRYYRVQ